MARPEHPQIYLITPPEIDLRAFPAQLAAVLDAHPVSCVRLALAIQDEAAQARAADACRDITHARDIALVIDRHVMLAARLGLDGVHLPDGARSIRKVRESLGPDAIIGSYCGISRHDGLNAGEAGADYISFGPAGVSALGDGSCAEYALFEWWSDMIEVPVVAEGVLDAALIRRLTPVTDFFGIGDEIWREDDPAAALGVLIVAMG